MSTEPAQPSVAPDDDLPITVVSSRPRVQLVQTVRDLITYRELFRAFIGRDLKVRYKQTALGVVWVVLQPLVTGGVFAVIFQKLRGGPTGGADFVASLLFFMSGLVPWNAFSSGLTKASSSMEGSANLITKVYFPRLAVPGAYVVGSLVDYSIAMTVLLVLAALTKTFTFMLILWILPLLLIQTAASAGLGFFFAALNAQYRDVKYVIPFLLTIGMLITVLLPLDSWSPAVRQILSWNPMAAVIETFRAELADKPVNFLLLAKGAITAFILLIGGTIFFRHRETKLVDIL